MEEIINDEGVLREVMRDAADMAAIKASLQTTLITLKDDQDAEKQRALLLQLLQAGGLGGKVREKIESEAPDSSDTTVQSVRQYMEDLLEHAIAALR